VLFGGQPGATIPAGAPFFSDPVDLKVEGLTSLSISLYFPEDTGPCTCHATGVQITCSMRVAPVASITSRSNPSAAPLAGGMCASAARKPAFRARWLGSDPASFAAVYRMLATMDMADPLARIACPVLWIAAADSDIPRWLSPQGDPREEIARRFAHIPNGTLEYVSDAGHMLHHDQPQAVARAIEQFLT